MSLISYPDALAKVLANSINYKSEIVPIYKALDRIIAEDIIADRDYPPFNRAAMDGIAIRSKDLSDNIQSYLVIEKIFPGKANEAKLKTGECYKIMTGSAVPASADCLIKIEDVEIAENVATIINKTEQKQYQNISAKGQDLKYGEIAVNNGTKITPSIIGLLVSLGKKEVLVRSLPSVNIITTGNEVFDVDYQVNDYQIRNSNKYVLQALLQHNKIEIKEFTHVCDNIKDLKNNIKKALEADILIITGGVSAGEADFIPEVLTELEIEKKFHKVAIKPGKPIWCGQKLNGAMVFALPGNPLSCLVTFKLFVEPYIYKYLGINQQLLKKASAKFYRTKKTTFREFFPAYLEDNQLKLMPLNGSGDIRLGTLANVIALQEYDQISEGDLIYYLDI